MVITPLVIKFSTRSWSANLCRMSPVIFTSKYRIGNFRSFKKNSDNRKILILLLTWSVIKSILHSITYKSLWPFVTKDLSLRGSPYHIGLYSQRLKTGHVWGIFKVENFIIPQGRQLIILSIFGISKCLWIFSLHWTNIVYGPSPCWWQFFSPRSVCRDGVSEE